MVQCLGMKIIINKTLKKIESLDKRLGDFFEKIDQQDFIKKLENAFSKHPIESVILLILWFITLLFIVVFSGAANYPDKAAAGAGVVVLGFLYLILLIPVTILCSRQKVYSLAKKITLGIWYLPILLFIIAMLLF